MPRSGPLFKPGCHSYPAYTPNALARHLIVAALISVLSRQTFLTPNCLKSPISYSTYGAPMKNKLFAIMDKLTIIERMR